MVVWTLQLASNDRCVLFRVCKMDGFPEKLREILVDPAIYKAGVGITGDQLKLHRDFGLVVQGAVDLSVLANTVHQDPSRRWKLDTMCSSVLKKRMDKKAGTRCTATSTSLWGHLTRLYRLYTTPHTPFGASDLAPMHIGCWLVLVIR